MPTQTTAAAAVASAGDELGQVLALLRVAGVDAPEVLAVGDGDRLLLALHRGLVGADVEVVATCDACGTASTAALTPDAVPAAVPRTALVAAGAGLRQPVYGDLLDLPPDREAAASALLSRCRVGDQAPPREAAALERIDDALTGPVVLDCVECGRRLEVAVDVQRLVLEGLARCALRVDEETHLLARAYGWSLADIESLPDHRRRRLATLVADER